jgi:hypothetical protein
MTRSADLKRLVRERMRTTGENYTAARAALLAARATAPSGSPAPEKPVAARAAHEKLIRPFLRDGVLVQVPARRKARLAVLIEILARFEPGRTYTESEVGDVLRPVHEDVAYLRRELVDYGYLEREHSGTYWVAREAPAREGNLAQEVTPWEQEWLPGFLHGRWDDGASPDGGDR